MCEIENEGKNNRLQFEGKSKVEKELGEWT